MIIKNFKPSKYRSKNDDDCLVLCVRVMLDFWHLSNIFQDIKKSIKKHQEGYDFLEMIDVLYENGLTVEAGLYDLDYIPLLGEGEVLNKERLFGKEQKDRELPKHAKQSLELLEGIWRDDCQIKIQNIGIDYLERWVEKGLPVCINVGLAELSGEDTDVIHSVVIYGVEGKDVYVWDPALGVRVVEKREIEGAWKAVGSYYLIIKKESRDISSPAGVEG